MATWQEKFNSRSKNFHAEIARRASELRPAPSRSFSVPNAPYGTPKKGVRIITDRYIHPKEFNASYEEAWMLEICGVDTPNDPYSSKLIIDRVKFFVAKFYQISIDDIMSDRRTAGLVVPRHLAMYLCRVLTPRSLPSIGRAFGGRDHTTIINAIKNTEARIERDPQFASIVGILRFQIGGGDK